MKYPRMKPPGTPGSAWRDALMGEDFGSWLESCDPDNTLVYV